MRLTKVLNAQHLGWHAKMKWRTLKRQTIYNVKTVDNLKAMGLPVIDPVKEFISERQIPEPPFVFDYFDISFLLNNNMTFIYFTDQN